jgi:hypothetical protein
VTAYVFEQVRGHARAVADVVADVVGDDGRVARVVLGMPASTLPTRSAPTSAPFVKMPPPSRAKIEISEPPNARPTSACSASQLAASAAGARLVARDAEKAQADDEQPVIGAALERNCSAGFRAAAPPLARVRTFERTETFMPM